MTPLTPAAGYAAQIAAIKRTLPPGPWQDEPDLVEWLTEAGLPALVRRVPMGVLCGYVAVPPGHWAHGKGYNDLEDLAVHGGLTFAAEAAEGWWAVGFDCGHAFDLNPMLLRSAPPEMTGTWEYRDLMYVRGEVESLASQLVTLRHNGVALHA